ncbi:MAG: hypothetical protein AMXMBFR64_34590 [Myxococcales bacterium]
MTSELTIRWQSFQVAVHGRGRVAARLEWVGRRSAVKDLGPLVIRVRPFPGTAVEGAFVVAGGEGAACPALPGDRYLVPPPASGFPFYVLLEDPAGGRVGFDVQVVPTWEEAAAVVHAVVDLADAWPNAPEDLAPEVATLRRLAGTGGHQGERRAYRRLAMEVLARSAHPEIEALRADLHSPEVADAMEADLGALCYAADIMAIAVLADAGQVAEVHRRLKDLPRSVRTDADVAQLMDVARAADPLPHQQKLLGAVVAARESGELEEALALVRHIGPSSPLYAEARGLHLETAADLIEGALRRGAIDAARELIRQEGRLFEEELGTGDPWWRSIRRAAGIERSDAAPDVPYAEVAEVIDLDEDDVESDRPGLIQKVRTWLRLRR